ncbi:hypothetical protein [Priestia koreensis]|uniref:hypothetical protein n=1 Tax=Priestia koreensis TaxID=284581 RepID=UPI001F55BCDC|nr:hypothetical protein [Priestia koreensis]UNL86507.1 hypothetical protein IE339_08485 [Priestia koreensis]
MDEQFKCTFRIQEVIDVDKQTKQAFIKSKMTDLIHEQVLFEGVLRVRFNEFGIYPVAKDIAAALPIPSLQKKLLAEVRRYLRPHKNFL